MSTLKARGPYNLRAEAAAFAEGVEWVNDSALELIDFYELDEQFYIVYRDNDYDEENEPIIAELHARGFVVA